MKFLGWFEDDENVFLAMEYFDLGTLNIYMTDDLKEQDAQSIALQLLEGLKIMHEEGFTHRDLKPEARVSIFDHVLMVVDVAADFLCFPPQRC